MYRQSMIGYVALLLSAFCFVWISKFLVTDSPLSGIAGSGAGWLWVVGDRFNFHMWRVSYYSWVFGVLRNPPDLIRRERSMKWHYITRTNSIFRLNSSSFWKSFLGKPNSITFLFLSNLCIFVEYARLIFWKF